VNELLDSMLEAVDATALRGHVHEWIVIGRIRRAFGSGGRGEMGGFGTTDHEIKICR